MYTCNTGVYRAEHQTSTISLSSKVSDVFVMYIQLKMTPLEVHIMCGSICSTMTEEHVYCIIQAFITVKG